MQLICPIVTTTNAPYIVQLKIKMPHSYNWTVIIIDILYQNDSKMGSIGNPVIQQVKEVGVSLEPRGNKKFVNLSNIMAEYPFKVCSLLPILLRIMCTFCNKIMMKYCLRIILGRCLRKGLRLTGQCTKHHCKIKVHTIHVCTLYSIKQSKSN